MSTTKLNTKVVNASVKSPASEKPLTILQTAEPVPADSKAKYLEGAVVVYANPQTEKDIPDFRYIYAVKGNTRYRLLMHGAVRYGALVKSKQARNIPYFVQVINGCKHWVVDAVPTAEELEAYNAYKVKPQVVEVDRTAESIAFFAGCFGGAKQ
jgi:hypothetical protein